MAKNFKKEIIFSILIVINPSSYFVSNSTPSGLCLLFCFMPPALPVVIIVQALQALTDLRTIPVLNVNSPELYDTHHGFLHLPNVFLHPYNFFMLIFLGVLWFLAAIVISLFIQRGFLKNSTFKLGLAMIILSFICGLSILVTALITI